MADKCFKFGFGIFPPKGVSAQHKERMFELFAINFALKSAILLK